MANNNYQEHKCLTWGIIIGAIIGTIIGIIISTFLSTRPVINMGTVAAIGMSIGAVIGTNMDYAAKK